LAARQAAGALLTEAYEMKKPMVIIRDAVEDDFWQAPPRARVNWFGVAGLALTAFSAGIFIGWVYGVYRLLQL
jgi:hypothetical protein